MDITLAPELEAFVQKKLASGEYASANDVMNEALNMWLEEEQEEEELRREIALGLAAYERGEYTTYTSETLMTLADEIIADGMTRRAEREKKSA